MPSRQEEEDRQIALFPGVDLEAPMAPQASLLGRLVLSGQVDADWAKDHLVFLETFAETGFDRHMVEMLHKAIDVRSGRQAFNEAIEGARNLHVRTRRGVELMIHPSVQGYAPPGSWQISRFNQEQARIELGEPLPGRPGRWRFPRHEGEVTLIPTGHHYAPSLEEAVNQAWNEHGGLELIERANPGDEGLRLLERAWYESGDPLDREAYAVGLARAGLLLPFLRQRWAELAARKRAHRFEVYSYRKELRADGMSDWRAQNEPLYPELADVAQSIADESLPLAEELAHELGRHGLLWATAVCGDNYRIAIRLHDEKDSPKGAAATDWVLKSASTGRGPRGESCLSLQHIGKGAASRATFEELRATYGARSRILELREAQEAIPKAKRSWQTAAQWRAMVRAAGREGREEGQVGWNPPEGITWQVDAGWNTGSMIARAFFNGQAIGLVGAYEQLHGWTVNGAWVSPTVRREGIATKLYIMLAEAACARGKPLVSEGFQRNRYSSAVWESLPGVEAFGQRSSPEPWSRHAAHGDYRIPCRNPPGDEGLRGLERAAAAGDRDAHLELLVARARAGLPLLGPEAASVETVKALIADLAEVRVHAPIYTLMDRLPEEEWAWAADQYWVARGIEDNPPLGDRGLRSLERAAAGGGPGELDRYTRELVRRGSWALGWLIEHELAVDIALDASTPGGYTPTPTVLRARYEKRYVDHVRDLAQTVEGSPYYEGRGFGGAYVDTGWTVGLRGAYYIGAGVPNRELARGALDKIAEVLVAAGIQIEWDASAIAPAYDNLYAIQPVAEMAQISREWGTYVALLRDHHGAAREVHAWEHET